MPTARTLQGLQSVAAAQADIALGRSGGVRGDRLQHLLIVPATTSPGAVSIKDGGGAAKVVFTGGAASVSSLVPFVAFVDANSEVGAWSVTTGADVSVQAVGDFT